MGTTIRVDVNKLFGAARKITVNDKELSQTSKQMFENQKWVTLDQINMDRSRSSHKSVTSPKFPPTLDHLCALSGSDMAEVSGLTKNGIPVFKGNQNACEALLEDAFGSGYKSIMKANSSGLSGPSEQLKPVVQEVAICIPLPKLKKAEKRSNKRQENLNKCGSEELAYISKTSQSSSHGYQSLSGSFNSLNQNSKPKTTSANDVGVIKHPIQGFDLNNNCGNRVYNNKLKDPAETLVQNSIKSLNRPRSNKLEQSTAPAILSLNSFLLSMLHICFYFFSFFFFLLFVVCP